MEGGEGREGRGRERKEKAGWTRSVEENGGEEKGIEECNRRSDGKGVSMECVKRWGSLREE